MIASVSGGARLWVGPKLLIDDWLASEIDRSVAIELPAGEHRVRVEYRDPGRGGASGRRG